MHYLNNTLLEFLANRSFRSKVVISKIKSTLSMTLETKLHLTIHMLSNFIQVYRQWSCESYICHPRKAKGPNLISPGHYASKWQLAVAKLVYTPDLLGLYVITYHYKFHGYACHSPTFPLAPAMRHALPLRSCLKHIKLRIMYVVHIQFKLVCRRILWHDLKVNHH